MQTASNMRFMVDHMLIKLGKYLRILGYDAEWDKASRTHELILRSNAEQRVFLTRNKRLPDQYPLPRRVVTVGPIDPVEQLWQLAADLELDVTGRLFSMCIRCNVVLDRVGNKEAIKSMVHPNVYMRYDAFYRCPRCATVFWKGSHVRNTCRKLRIAVSLILCAAAVWAVSAAAAGDELLERLGRARPTQLVNDYAGVITGSRRASLAGVLSELERKTGAEIAVRFPSRTAGQELSTT